MPKASAPVPAEVRQARTFVILVFGQIRVCELSYRNEHERVAKALISSGEREMKVVSLARKAAIVEHRKCRDRVKLAPNRRFAPTRGTIRTTKGARSVITVALGPEDQPRISRCIAEERLQNLEDQDGTAEQAKREHKVVDAREGKVPLAQKSQLDHWIVMMPFAPDRSGYRDHRDCEKGRDEMAPEPVVALTPVQHDFQAGKSNRYQHDTDVVDPELAAPPGLAAFLREFWRVMNQPA
jgi:hypothetical protein